MNKKSLIKLFIVIFAVAAPTFFLSFPLASSEQQEELDFIVSGTNT